MISKSANKNRAGFSLMELAIVMAIIGVVLASLWGVVSVVRENVKREETLEQMTVVVSKIRDHFLGRACVSTTFACPSPTADLTNDLMTKGVLLPEQYRKGTNPALADHPWGSSGGTGTFVVRAVGRDQFSIELNSLSAGACVALAPKLSGVGSPSGLTAMTINTGGVVLPVSPETAGTECDAASNEILLTYRLRN